MAQVGALLVGPAWRRVPWLALAVAAVLGAAAVGGRAAQVDATVELLPVLRLAAVLLAAAAATCLEDGCETLTGTTPFGRPRRRLLAVALTLTTVAALWLVIVVVGLWAYGPARAGAGGVPVAGLTVELGALCAVGWAIGASLGPDSVARGAGPRAGMGLLVGVVLTLVHPPVRGWLWAFPGPGTAGLADGLFGSGRARWWLIGAVCFAAFGLLSRDPASSRVVRRTVRHTRRSMS